MQDKALYLLAKFDDETQNTLSEYYKILNQNGLIGNQTKDIPYHFTLGCFDVDREEMLIDELNKICSETSCIDIKLDHIGLFGLKVLFIEPNLNIELLELEKKFFSHCANGFHHWTAHATLLLDEPENILKALPIITENFKPFPARIESIGLYEFFPTRFVCEHKLK